MDNLWLVGGDLQLLRRNDRVEVRLSPDRKDQHIGCAGSNYDNMSDMNVSMASLDRSEAARLRDWLDRFLENRPKKIPGHREGMPRCP